MSDNKSGPPSSVPKRQAGPISPAATDVLTRFEQKLREVEDLSSSTLRAYLADLNHFAFWCEARESGETGQVGFGPDQLTTPLLTRYRSHLQQELHLKPASVNRALVSLKRFCAWAEQAGLAPRDVAGPVRFVRLEPASPRGLTDQEEDALVRAVNKHGGPRDVAIIVLILHTGLRAGETCRIQRRDMTLGKRSGNLTVTGKGNKVRDVPLNATAREALGRYLPSVQADSQFVFPSDRQDGPISTRALDHLIRKYAHLAKLQISPTICGTVSAMSWPNRCRSTALLRSWDTIPWTPRPVTHAPPNEIFKPRSRRLPGNSGGSRRSQDRRCERIHESGGSAAFRFHTSGGL